MLVSAQQTTRVSYLPIPRARPDELSKLGGDGGGEGDRRANREDGGREASGGLFVTVSLQSYT